MTRHPNQLTKTQIRRLNRHYGSVINGWTNLKLVALQSRQVRAVLPPAAMVRYLQTIGQGGTLHPMNFREDIPDEVVLSGYSENPDYYARQKFNKSDMDRACRETDEFLTKFLNSAKKGGKTRAEGMVATS